MNRGDLKIFFPEKEKKDTVKKTCQRTFQALRIDVNNEFEVLYEFMEKIAGCLETRVEEQQS